MRRVAWVILVTLVTVGVAVEMVRAQIVFPDGSAQDTAYPGMSAVPTGAAFSQTQFFSSGAGSGPIGSVTVPAGQELVVLKAIGWNTVLCTLESRLPSPNQNTGPVTLAALIRPDATNNALFEMDFPDGAVVVDEGRQPYLAFRSGTNFGIVTATNQQTITVIGYLRPKT